MSRSNWKSPFADRHLWNIINKPGLKKKIKCKTWSRQSTITAAFVGVKVRIHTGKQFTTIRVVEEMVGHKLGEFALTRTKFSFKKTKKK